MIELVEIETKPLDVEMDQIDNNGPESSLNIARSPSSLVADSPVLRGSDVHAVANPLESIDSHEMETMYKIPNIDRNYSMVQLIANSIKVELYEAATTHSNRNKAQSGSASDADDSKIEKQTIQRQKFDNQNEAPKERLKCDECGKLFKSKPSMIEHLITHTNERPFECWLCHKKYCHIIFRKIRD